MGIIDLQRSLSKKAEKVIPGFHNLSPVMLRRALEWLRLSETRWVDGYSVSVRVIVGKSPRTLLYKFEEEAHAKACVQWWREHGYDSNFKVL